MAACHLPIASTRQGDSAMWVDHSGLGCNGKVCRFQNILTATGETSYANRIVSCSSHVGGNQYLQRTILSKNVEDTQLRCRRNATKVFALKPPREPVPLETGQEPDVGSSDEKATKEAEEKKVIKVEKKGLLGQIQNFFAWIGAWPNIPQKVLFHFLSIPGSDHLVCESP